MRIVYLLAPIILTGLILAACHEPVETPKAQDSVMQQLINEPVKTFALTQYDQHDISILNDYDNRFNEMSDATEDELIAMREAGTLSEDFALLRKRDNIGSALIMLKDLDLKTEQGRYIQGIMYDYWQQQDQLYAARITGSNTLRQQDIAMQGIGHFLHAHQQLEHWQAQYQP